MNWICKKFDELSPKELYEILKLRSEVFVVEQNCVFLDMDDKDEQSLHLMGWNENKLVAYTRLLNKGIAYEDYPSIGRVVTSPSARKSGIGRLLMEKSIEELYHQFGKSPIKIGAQYYLKNFYESLGFRQAGEIYLEDGIQHIPMLK